MTLEKDKGMLISFTQTSESKDEELREWFVREHIDERALDTPGFYRARLYESIGTGPKYFATYETETIDVLCSEEYFTRVGNQTRWSKEIISHLTLLDRMTAQLTLNHMHGFGSLVATIRFFPGQEKDTQSSIRKALGEKLFPSMLTSPGILGVCLAENIPEVSNATGNQARSFGGSPLLAESVEWLVVLEGYIEDDIIRLSKEAFGDHSLNQLGIEGAATINYYKLLYGNYRT